MPNRSRDTRRERASDIARLVFRNEARPDAPIEAVRLSALRRRAPDGFLERPHRAAFHVLLVATDGEWRHEVDFRRMTAKPRSVIWIQPGQVHRFVSAKPDEGWVLFFQPNALRRDFAIATTQPYDLGARFDDARWLVERLHAYGRRGSIADAEGALERALLEALLILVVADELKRERTEPIDRLASIQRMFELTLERRFTRTRRVEDYATAVGYSAKTLTRASLAAHGLSAKRVIDLRVILEAQRLLAYSNLLVGQIASRLGFSEPTNFVKFFRAHTRQSPAEFRASYRR